MKRTLPVAVAAFALLLTGCTTQPVQTPPSTSTPTTSTPASPTPKTTMTPRTTPATTPNTSQPMPDLTEPAPASPEQPAPNPDTPNPAPDNNTSQETSPLLERARESAQLILDAGGISREELINQTRIGDITDAEATTIVDSLGADWNEQAAIAAKNYVTTLGTATRDDLITALTGRGFTAEQAAAGAAAVGL